MITDRVYNLVKGDIFIFMGTKYKVTLVDDRNIYYAYVGEGVYSNGWHNGHFGAYSQARVEIVKKANERIIGE